MNQCPKCKKTFSESGFCPFDGVALISLSTNPVGLEPISPEPSRRAHHSSGYGSDDLATHSSLEGSTLTGSAVNQVLLELLKTRKIGQLIGTEIDGRYYIERQIGEGGMGVVFLARHLVIEKLVAIKVLRPEVAVDDNVVKRFVQEAKAASRIGHPNIIDVTDFGTTKDGLTYQVMEYLEGETLAALLRKQSPLDIPQALGIAAQVARALGAAHAKGIVHRDLKPENIFIIHRDGRSAFVKIVDFGIAKVLPAEGAREGTRLTRDGTVFGTPEYMAPEQATGRSDVDLRADIYALGIILYEMLCGKVPHKGKTTVRTLAMQMLDKPQPMHEVNPDCPVSESLEAVILQALAKKPEQRYENMKSFLTALEEATSNTELDLARLMEEERKSSEIAATSGPAHLKNSSTKKQALIQNQSSEYTDSHRQHRESAMPLPLAESPEEDLYFSQNRARTKLKIAALVMLLSLILITAFVLLGKEQESKTVAQTTISDTSIEDERAHKQIKTTAKTEASTPPLEAGNHVPPPRSHVDRKQVHHRKNPDNKTQTDSAVVKKLNMPIVDGELEVTIFTRPRGAQLFIGRLFAGGDGTNLRRPLGTTHTVSCYLKGYKAGSVKVLFDGSNDVFICRLSKKRTKKCVEGTKNPFDDCS